MVSLDKACICPPIPHWIVETLSRHRQIKMQSANLHFKDTMVPTISYVLRMELRGLKTTEKKDKKVHPKYIKRWGVWKINPSIAFLSANAIILFASAKIILIPMQQICINTGCWQDAAGGRLGWVSDPPLSTWQCFGISSQSLPHGERRIWDPPPNVCQRLPASTQC